MIIFHLLAVILMASVAGAQHNSLLDETPETWEIVSLLKVYDTFDEEGPTRLRRIGKCHDGGYVIPEQAMLNSDLVLGYGISDDISFEEEASRIFEKPSYGFDCTCIPVKTDHPLCHFVPQCIVPKRENRPDQFFTFDAQLHELSALGKKIFLKMDIEGDEYGVFPDILRHASDLTGIVLEIHFQEDEQLPQALHLLQDLDRDFLLVHLHGNNYAKSVFTTRNSKGPIPRVLELTYINRNLVHHYHLSGNQDHPDPLDMANDPDTPDAKFSIYKSLIINT